MDIVNIEIEKKDIKISKSQKVDGEIVQYGSDNLYPSRIASLIEHHRLLQPAQTYLLNLLLPLLLTVKLGKQSSAIRQPVSNIR